METIDVVGSGTTTVVENIAGEEVRSADLADALYKIDPDVQLIRRSGIANDIALRGMRKDNINVLIDGAKLYGGCPNRMDPPISHVLANNVDHLVVKEGPYDVQHFGTLTGLVMVDTLEPSKALAGEVTLNAGSWNYSKMGARVSGGSDRIRLLVSGSTESSGQYKDGDGRTLAEQVDDFAKNYPKPNPFDPNSPAGKKWLKVQGARYAPSYYDMKAYEKKTGMVKLFADVTENQTLRVSYTYNHSTDVMYPNTPMDAKEDTSHLFNAKYRITDLGEWSKTLEFEFYNSWVFHPMGTYFRRSALGAMGVIENVMRSRIYGGNVKNGFDLFGGTLRLGIDASRRSWDGEYRRNGEDWTTAASDGRSIDDYRARQAGLFGQFDKRFARWEIEVGLRYDCSKVRSEDPDVSQKRYHATSGYLFSNYHVSDATKIFAGLGVAARIPDGKELYFTTNPGLGGVMVGNPDLKQVKNYQCDLGIETAPTEMSTLRVKGFYSRLKDFIFYNASKMSHRYENRDASLYGLSIDGTYAYTDTIYFDGGVAYLRGKKSDPLTGQSDTDMPNITPLKMNLGANWDFDETGTVRLSMVAASGWHRYDADNGEQALSGYAVFNLKVTKDFLDRYRVTLGVDNLLDKTYTVTNTYADMTLVTGGEPMLIAEPGRYVYGHLTWHF